jgi:predicted HAD superfamily hydrolase
MQTLKSPHPEIRIPAHALPAYAQLKQQVDAAEAVSFDFFDTLFVRTLLDPEDAFDIVGKRWGIDGFRHLRRAAQMQAFQRMHQAGKKEITLDGIYACFAHCSVPAEILKKSEYELELLLLHPNAELIALFLQIVASGKPVVLTSDMYLPVEFFQQAFRNHGLPAVPVFVSADCNATKRDQGDLFDIVATKLGVPHGKILHIGDNENSDVKQAKAKGLAAFYYQEHRRPPGLKQAALEASIARGLLRKHSDQIAPGSFHELGFLYGGPAALGFLDWISAQAKRDKIDRILFLARDGYILERIAHLHTDAPLPKSDYFLGSRTVFTLAAINESNFSEFLPFLVAGADGLSPSELLDRIGVVPPADSVMEDLGLGSTFSITLSKMETLKEFLYAYRWEILKVCRRNRQALFAYLKELAIKAGDRVALVDIGWNGTTQDAFERAIQNMLEIDVFGYYFCLADTPDRIKRQQTRRMSALISSVTHTTDLVARVYENRVGAEFFFSAPHPSVIGLEINREGRVVAREDVRIDGEQTLRQISTAVSEGMEIFARSYLELQQAIQLPLTPLDIAMPLIEFMVDKNWHQHPLFSAVKNFDDWSFTANRETFVGHY